MKEKRAQKIIGVIVSDRMQKTRVVAVTRLKKHPLYGKYIKITKRYKAHDEKNEYRVGDRVEIHSIAPMSKEKHWTIAKLISRKSAGQREEGAIGN